MRNETKFTPGDWNACAIKYAKNGDDVIVSVAPRPSVTDRPDAAIESTPAICICVGKDSVANAIAIAALPALYAALEEITEWCSNRDDRNPVGLICKGAQSIAGNALKLARGES